MDCIIANLATRFSIRGKRKNKKKVMQLVFLLFKNLFYKSESTNLISNCIFLIIRCRLGFNISTITKQFICGGFFFFFLIFALIWIIIYSICFVVFFIYIYILGAVINIPLSTFLIHFLNYL